MICKLNCQTLAGVAADALGFKSPGCCCCEYGSLEDATQTARAWLEESSHPLISQDSPSENAATSNCLRGSPGQEKEYGIL